MRCRDDLRDKRPLDPRCDPAFEFCEPVDPECANHHAIDEWTR